MRRWGMNRLWSPILPVQRVSRTHSCICPKARSGKSHRRLRPLEGQAVRVHGIVRPLQLFFLAELSHNAEGFSAEPFPVTITSSRGFTVVPDASADVDPDLDGIRVEVSKDNKKKKGQGEQQVVDQLSIGTAFFDRASTCDPNG